MEREDKEKLIRYIENKCIIPNGRWWESWVEFKHREQDLTAELIKTKKELKDCGTARCEGYDRLSTELESVKCDNETLIIQNKNMKEFGISVAERNSELITELTEAKLDIVRNQNIILEMEQEAKEAKEKLGKITGDTSDGYHTFNELYEHRVLLWINLVLLEQKNSYLVENHFDGWFLLGMETKAGLISYHCPNKYLYLVSRVQRRNPVYDGHTSNDVIERLKKVAQALVTAINGKE